MTDKELAEYFATGREGDGHEFKGSLPKTDAVFFAKVTRAVLAMANRVGGGLVIIGVNEDANHVPSFDGLSDTDLQTWNPDDVSDALAPYADPSVVVDVDTNSYNGRKFVVIRVEEFTDIPVICKKQFVNRHNPDPSKREILRKGAVYVRPRGKPTSSEITSQTEMRDLLDLATDKALAAFLARTRRAGMELPQYGATADAAQFAADIAEELQESSLFNELTNELALRGHWEIRIHPVRYIKERIPYRELGDTLGRAKVQLRGSDFPHTDSSRQFDRGLTSIGNRITQGYFRAVWRFYQSGQLAAWLGIPEDWIDPNQQFAWGPPRGVRVLGIDETLFRFTEIFAFAARLALTPAGDDPMRINVEIRNLHDRHLWVDNRGRWPFDNEYQAHFHTFPFETVVSSVDLQANYKRLAVDATADLFSRFGWNPPDQMLVEQQDKLRS